MNNFKCPRCNGNVFSHGLAGSGKKRWECCDCGYRTTNPLSKDSPIGIVERNLIIADTHAPFENKRALAAIYEYMAEYKPTRIIHIGDVGDYQSVSHWLKDRRLTLEGLNIQDDLFSAMELLQTIGRCAPDAQKIVLLGNHEKWVYDYVESHPELRKTINVSQSYGVAGWETKPFNELYKLGKLYTTHGLYTNKYHSFSTVHALSASCAYGHTHDHQVYTESFLDGEKMAMSLGCMCDMNPVYLQNRPKRWVNGFATVDVIPTGDFFIDFIKLIGDRFCRMGKVYGK